MHTLIHSNFTSDLSVILKAVIKREVIEIPVNILSKPVLQIFITIDVLSIR